MPKEKIKKQQIVEEASLLDLIVIVFKNWRSGLVFFIFLYLFGTGGFLIYKAVKNKANVSIKISPSSKEYVLNEVKQGYIWYSDVKNYDDFSNLEILFNGTGVLDKCSFKPSLKCEQTAGGIIVYSEDEPLLNIKIDYNEKTKFIQFISEQISTDKKSKSIPLKEINSINDRIINTLIGLLNEKIMAYDELRSGIIQNMKKLSLKKEDSADHLYYLGAIYAVYKNKASPYARTKSNIYIKEDSANAISDNVQDNGVSFKNFTLMFLVFDLFLSMLVVFIVEYAKQNNLLQEIKKALKEYK